MTDVSDRPAEEDVADADRVRFLMQEVEHLRIALRTRLVIGQAEGILMAQLGMTEDEAFDHLTDRSQRSNMKLREVAEEIVAAIRAGGR